ncbi:uncharacterized protein LOC134248805 isoform X2 [Saccostrea cucullata]|uniref:uncharacterized protein LOC134248805 isoform X2 n=1 Tax=Saccostrea cuccullata TaxID=36930 RepID=UPI002ED40595
MASTVYDKRVIFTSRHFKKEVLVKLNTQNTPVWIPLQITEKSTRTLILYFFLDDGSKTSSSLILTVPLHFSLSANVNDYTCEALLQDDRDGKELAKELKQSSDVRSFSVDVTHTPPSTYTVTDLKNPNVEYGKPLYGPSQASSELDFSLRDIQEGLRKLNMTAQEVILLYGKACSHMSSMGAEEFANFVPITHLYRSKPILHFLNIYNNTNGIMYKYIKNFGGDPSSTLNRKLHGLFFSANIDPLTGRPPDVSYYGDQRIHIPVMFMINSDINLYFADFYCHYVNHHVTLVVTLKGSEADLFCSKRLMPLDPNFNVFLFRRPHALHAMVNSKITVEVFYTESINIVQMINSRCAFLTSVTQKGNAALKTAVGLPKRRDCKICNLKTNS